VLARLTALRVPPFAVAQKDALAVASAGGGRKGLETLRHSKGAKSAPLMQATSAGLALSGSQRGALAAMLVASGDAPSDPGMLASIGGMLAAYGKPLDGLAYIARSSSVRGPRPALLGWKEPAIALANQGYALFKLKRYHEAIAPLRSAIALSPELAEAESTLGAALLCSGDTAGGVAALRAGARRQHYAVIVHDARTGFSRPTAEEVFDLSAVSLHVLAKQVVLPSLKYASTPDQLPDLNAHYAKLSTAGQAVYSAATAAESAARSRWEAGLKHESKATRDRQQSMVLAALGAKQEPQVLAAERAVAALDTQGATSKIVLDFATAVNAHIRSCAPSDACFKAWCTSAAVQANSQYLPLENAYDSAVRKLWAEEGRVMLGVAGASDNPDLQAYIRALATQRETTLYGSMIDTATPWSGAITFLKLTCTNTAPPPVANADATPAAETGARCSEEGAGHGVYKVSLGGATLGVTCDHIEVSAASEGLVGAFGKTEIGKDGSTFTIGARGGAFGADWESGVYVKRGKDGIEDFGWRTGPSVDVRAGPVSINPNFTQIDISFVGAVDYIPTAFGFGGPAPPPGG